VGRRLSGSRRTESWRGCRVALLLIGWVEVDWMSLSLSYGGP